MNLRFLSLLRNEKHKRECGKLLFAKLHLILHNNTCDFFVNSLNCIFYFGNDYFFLVSWIVRTFFIMHYSIFLANYDTIVEVVEGTAIERISDFWDFLEFLSFHFELYLPMCHHKIRLGRYNM